MVCKRRIAIFGELGFTTEIMCKGTANDLYLRRQIVRLIISLQKIEHFFASISRINKVAIDKSMQFSFRRVFIEKVVTLFLIPDRISKGLEIELLRPPKDKLRRGNKYILFSKNGAWNIFKGRKFQEDSQD